MGQATGTSVKGTQGLLYDASGVLNAAVKIDGGFPSEAKNQGFVSVHAYNGVNFYYVDGKSLWYEGVVFINLPLAGLSLYVVASWKYDGLLWTVDTF